MSPAEARAEVLRRNKAREINQSKVALHAGIGRTTFYNWLTSIHDPSDASVWLKILNVLNDLGEEAYIRRPGRPRNRPAEDTGIETGLGYTLHSHNPPAHSDDLDVVRKALLHAIVTTREEDDRRKIARAFEALGVAR